MENYFWVVSQTHCYEGTLKGDDFETSDEKDIMDVLALGGPNTLSMSAPQKKMPCIVDAIIARAFELSLVIERQSCLHAAASWMAIAESLIPQPLPQTCEAKPCPLFFKHQSRDEVYASSEKDGRVTIDVSACSDQAVETLQWALADLRSPLTALGRARGRQRYALVGAQFSARCVTHIIPDNLWKRILSLLLCLGVQKLTTRLQRAALFVWNLVNCAVHKGLKDVTVIDYADEICRCTICDAARKRSRLASTTESLPDNNIHMWWTAQLPWEEYEQITLLHPLTLCVGAIGDASLAITVEMLKLRVVEELSFYEDFCYHLRNRFANAKLEEFEVESLSGEVVRREMHKFWLTDPESYGNILQVFHLQTGDTHPSKSLVYKPESLKDGQILSSELTYSHIRHQMNSSTGWMRLQYLTSNVAPEPAPLDKHYQQVPCRLFTVPATDDPRLFIQSCSIHKAPTTGPAEDYQQSYIELSDVGGYTTEIWRQWELQNDN